jgi:hypothetical protein
VRNLFLIPVAFLLLQLYACRKIKGNSDVRITVVDDVTGQPIPGVNVILAALAVDTRGTQNPRSLAMNADEHGVFQARIDKELLDSDEPVGSTLLFYADQPYYAVEKISVPLGEKVKKELRLIRAAEIDINYRHTNQGTIVDSFEVGIKIPNDEYSLLNISSDYIDYYRTHNLMNRGGQIVNDTTIKIICNPLTTKEFYYRIPGKTIHTWCDLKSGEMKMINVEY